MLALTLFFFQNIFPNASEQLCATFCRRGFIFTWLETNQWQRWRSPPQPWIREVREHGWSLFCVLDMKFWLSHVLAFCISVSSFFPDFLMLVLVSYHCHGIKFQLLVQDLPQVFPGSHHCSLIYKTWCPHMWTSNFGLFRAKCSILLYMGLIATYEDVILLLLYQNFKWIS